MIHATSSSHHVRFHDGRYHGMGDWPPSPARLFQALVAGIGQDGPLSDNASKPLEWLEALDPPVIAAPTMKPGMTIPMHFVPNNDLDALGGLASNLPKTRTAYKVWKPKLFNQQAAFLYGWPFDETDDSLPHAQRICEQAERLYQLGRGIDQAWAVGAVIDPQQLEELLLAYRGVVHRPTGADKVKVLACPQQGSLKSLKDRYKTMSQRFSPQRRGPVGQAAIRTGAETRFTQTAYNSPPGSQVFELASRTNQTDKIAWPLYRISTLVMATRDSAVAKLKGSLPDQESQIEKCLVGRKADGTDAARRPHGSASCHCPRSAIITRIAPFVVFWLKSLLGVRYALMMSSGHSQALN